MSVAGDIDHQLRILRILNDTFRQTFVGGRVVLTQSIAADIPLKYALLTKLRAFQNFNKDADVDRDHSFGVIDHDGEVFWWKIDYYDPDMEHGSEDPTDQLRTVRVLTLMRPSEY